MTSAERDRETQRQRKTETVRHREIELEMIELEMIELERIELEIIEIELERKRGRSYLFYEWSHHFVCLLQCSPSHFVQWPAWHLVCL